MEPPSASPESASGSNGTHDRPTRPLLGSFVGMGGMACVLFLIFAAIKVAPWWAMVLLIAIWLVLFVLGTRWFMTRPLWVAALPVVMLGVWFATIALGAFLLGWSA